MKLIGMIGGMSWVSSLKYYRLLNEYANAALGGNNAATLLMYSVNTALTEKCIEKGDWDGATDILLDAARRLEAGGAELMIIASNTMHRCADAIAGEISIPLLHIADATARAVTDRKIKKIGLLGTRPTMEESFYKGIMTMRHDLDVIVPPPEDRQKIEDIIFGELCRDIIRPESAGFYKQTIRNLAEQGAEGIILGCTEIGLLIEQNDFPALPLFDTTDIHCKDTVRTAARVNIAPGTGYNAAQHKM